MNVKPISLNGDWDQNPRNIKEGWGQILELLRSQRSPIAMGYGVQALQKAPKVGKNNS